MAVVAKLRYVSISTQKARLIANQIRGISANLAINQLAYSNKKAAKIIKKILESAIANAENNEGLDIDELVLHNIYIDNAPTSKRMRARAKGRGNHILRRKCHITIEVAQKQGKKG